MSDTLPQIRGFLENCGLAFEVWDCDPDLADTVQFCAHYGVPVENSVNSILVRSKTGDRKHALCVLLATHLLDVNHTVRKKLGARRVSFADAKETGEITGMEIGGVTPIGLPPELPVWVDAAVMQREYIILGGGNRSSKLKVPPELVLRLPAVEIVTGLARLRS